jgi:hypothetical protein
MMRVNSGEKGVKGLWITRKMLSHGRDEHYCATGSRKKGKAFPSGWIYQYSVRKRMTERITHI